MDLSVHMTLCIQQQAQKGPIRMVACSCAQKRVGGCKTPYSLKEEVIHICTSTIQSSNQPASSAQIRTAMQLLKPQQNSKFCY